MIRLGLTGSIGMGKSTTARMFAERGVPTYDADAAVHQLYAGKAAPLIEAAFPGTTVDGVVDRRLLKPHVLGRPDAMKKLEAIVHPLVQQEEAVFLERARLDRKRLVVLDIPLLFETANPGRVDAAVVVSAPAEIQRTRVMARPGMTEETFDAILKRQMPDKEKRQRAHFLIDTGRGLDAAERNVVSILRALSAAG